MKVIYYYHYLFYKNILGESEPKSVAIFVVSFSESLLINSLIGTILAYYYCIDLSNYVMISIFGIILLLNFLFFLTSKKTTGIIKGKPKLFGSHILSISLAWLFFLISFASLFWMGLYLKINLANCH